MTVASASAGVNSVLKSVSAIGILILGTTRSTPNATANDPLTCSNFGTFTFAKERIKTKKAISRVAMSANVAIQGGDPPGHSGQSGGTSRGGRGPSGSLEPSIGKPSSSSSTSLVSASLISNHRFRKRLASLDLAD